MNAINHKPTFIPSIKLIVYMTSFEIVGDELIVQRDVMGPSLLNTSTHKSRILGLRGTARVEIPGYGVKECVAGDMFPEDGIDYDFPKESNIHIVSSSDNTAFIGITPYPNKVMVTDRIQLSPNDTYTVSQGSLAVILCDSFTVNGNESTESYKILTCQNTDAVVVAASQGQIIKFTAV
jgi:hypothetical protein